MTGELGQLALCFALALSLVMAASGLMGATAGAGISRTGAAHRLRHRPWAFGVRGVWPSARSSTPSSTSDFSIALVANNSHTLKPLIYKITGVWGNHEGSMLLWVLVLSLYAGAGGGAAARRRAADQRGAGRAGAAGRGVPALHSFHLQSVSAPRSRALRRRRAQSVAAGSRPRHASAHALRGLCRAFGVLFLRRGRACWWAKKAGRAPRGLSC